MKKAVRSARTVGIQSARMEKVKGIKMTPSLARALAERVVSRINEVRREQNNATEEEVKQSKEFKRMLAICEEKRKLDAEYAEIEKIIKTLHPSISHVGVQNYGPKAGEHHITFNNPWVNSEVIKNQILLNGTFTNDSVDSLVDTSVAEHLKK